MTVPARLTRRGAKSIVRSSTWYPTGPGVTSGVFAVPAWGAMVKLPAGPPSAVMARCYAGSHRNALAGASQHPPGYELGWVRDQPALAWHRDQVGADF